MKNYCFATAQLILSFLFLVFSCSTAFKENESLLPGKVISLPGVDGRIDHLAINIEERIVYIAALSNNTVEVVDLKKGIVIHTIKNLDEPQGIIFIRSSNSLFVANGGNGECDIFNASSFQKTDSLKLEGDADNVRYDSTGNKIYVGYGEGGIAVIDATTFKLLEEIKLPGHPESFQLTGNNDTMFVNVPDAHKIEVIDLKEAKIIVEWKMTENGNFPMAIDNINHLLFIGCRHPSELVVMNEGNGNKIASPDCSADADDIFYNSETKEIYISCGAGYINIFRQNEESKYDITSRIATRNGARTGLFVPALKQFLLAVPASITNNAELRIYEEP